MVLIFIQFLFFCMLFLDTLSYWYIQKYGDISIENILFHLSVPLKNAPLEIFDGIMLPILFSVLSFFLVIIWVRFKNKYIGYLSLFFLSFIFGLYYFEKHFSLSEFVKNQFSASNFIEENYVFPDDSNITFPKDKKNLIVIQVESLESSYADKENGGFFDKNYIPELTDIAKNNLSFSTSSKMEGAMVLPESGWTIAAVVSETAGIPLKLFGHTYLNNKFKNMEIDNSMGKYQYFLPGAITLGDILEKNGYKNYLFLGTGSTFAGNDLYFKEHGKYTIYDVYSMKKFKTEQYIHDDKLFQFVKEKLTTEIRQNEPWHLFIQTYDTHFAPKEKFLETSSIISLFLNWLKSQPYFKDTVVVIVGDHCNMNQNDFVGIENEEFRYTGNKIRKVFNTFINSEVQAIQETNRKFSTLDFFPTILASIGVQIKNERLGLGINLFSKDETLLEKYGDNFIFEEISKKSSFYNKHLLSE